MKLNLKMLSLVCLFSASLFIVSCADEGSDSADNSAENTEQSAEMSTDASQSTTKSIGTGKQTSADDSKLSTRNNNNKNANQAPTGPTTSIKFDEPRHDFGTLTSGDKAKHKYEFTNTGDEPLVISNVKASCGCTAPSYSKEPVAPGERGFIDVVYSASGKGSVSKNVTITANTEPAKTMIYLKANVVKKEK